MYECIVEACKAVCRWVLCTLLAHVRTECFIPPCMICNPYTTYMHTSMLNMGAVVYSVSTRLDSSDSLPLWMEAQVWTERPSSRLKLLVSGDLISKRWDSNRLGKSEHVVCFIHASGKFSGFKLQNPDKHCFLRSHLLQDLPQIHRYTWWLKD